MINIIHITRTELKQYKKDIILDGWQSAHYYTRRGTNVDRLRNLAKKGNIGAKVLNIEGFQTSWYYHESEVNELREKFLLEKSPAIVTQSLDDFLN
ncbi:hypothetical protein [Brevibacillus reuszeri]|uniref:hypothetical protein n=1 Tax=Brevibacillus reuszeri TaxID=54915 RepID=UPI000CCC2019|nr:hypothetical protein [Brevibacillus reuszeri]